MIKNRHLFITYTLTTALILNIITCEALSQWRYPDMNATVQAVQQWAQKNRMLLAGLTTLLAGAIIWKFMQQSSSAHLSPSSTPTQNAHQPAFIQTYYINGTLFSIKQGFIDKEQVEVLVNAANEKLKRGGGVCGSIFNAAGKNEPQLVAQCKEYTDVHEKLPAGQAHFTPITYPTPSTVRGIIHAVSPTIKNSGYQEKLPTTDETAKLLKSAYTNALNIAQNKNINSIAFPLLGAGAFGFSNWDNYNAPNNPFRPALEAIVEFAQKKSEDVNPKRINLVLINNELAGKVNSTFQEHYPDLKPITNMPTVK